MKHTHSTWKNLNGVGIIVERRGAVSSFVLNEIRQNENSLQVFVVENPMNIFFVPTVNRNNTRERKFLTRKTCLVELIN